MTKIENTIFCDNCGIEITWAPIISGSHHYCCQECKVNLKCDCGPAIDWEDEGRGSRTGMYNLELYG